MEFEEYQPPREISVVIGPGISGTVAIPHAVDGDVTAGPATTKMALILHGQGGHRNYCYQKRVAHAIAKEYGIYSLRIDFRGCGDLADNKSEADGRVLSQDVEDIQACADWIVSAEKNGLGINFTLSLIIAHSRGGVAMFLWAIAQNDRARAGKDAIIVPNLVNCSARFRSWMVIDRYPLFTEDFDKIPQEMIRHGKKTPVPIMREELLDLARVDMTPVRDLPLEWSTLCVYGLNDQIIPIEDLAYFSNALNRGYDSNKLEIIPHADHNFYGVVPIEGQEDAMDYNPHGYPLNKRKLVNFNYEVVDRILAWLKPEEELKRFVSALRDIGHFPRWKQVDGVANFRDAGGWKINQPTFPVKGNHSYYVTANLVYRCALMTGITHQGIDALKQLGVAMVFDLRSDGEVKDDGVAEKLAQAGISRRHTPVFANDDYLPELIAMRYKNLMSSWSTYVKVYEAVLEQGHGAYKQVFEYIRDDGRPFLFHCTAGKDRTGVLAMLILLLCGVDRHTIAREYELTAVGLKPDFPKIRENFVAQMTKLREKMGDSANDLEMLISEGRPGWKIEEDGFNNLISSRYEAMLATLELFHAKYGSVVSYMKEMFAFTEEDIGMVYDRLVVCDSELLGFTTGNPIKWLSSSNERAKI